MNLLKDTLIKRKFFSLFIIGILVIAVGATSAMQYKKSVSNLELKNDNTSVDKSGDRLKVVTDSSQHSVSEQTPNADSPSNATVGQSSPQTRGATTSNSKPYSVGVCTETPIPYKTVYENNPYLTNGVQRIRQEGKDGFRSTCTPDSNGKQVLAGYTYPGYDKIIETGTYVAPATSTYQPPKNYSQCQFFADTSAYKACVDAINRQ